MQHSWSFSNATLVIRLSFLNFSGESLVAHQLKIHPLFHSSSALQGLAPASLSTSLAISSHISLSYKLSPKRLQTSVCDPWLCFAWVPSSLLFPNSCLLSKWGMCPLSWVPLTAWSYLSPYAYSLFYCIYLSGCDSPTGLCDLSKVSDYVWLTFHPDA